MPISIVFQNSNFAVVHKPAGTLSVPSRMGLKDPRPVAGLWLQDHLAQKVYPVHRLDEDTSGLLLFALTAAAASAGNNWFESHTIVKTYEAISLPVPEEDDKGWEQVQTWESRLMRGKRRAYEASFGKSSVTKSKLVGATADGRSIWHLQPITGRAHQLRYEMSRHGFPIDGDHLYGSKESAKNAPGIDLCAFHLDFSHCPDYSNFEIPSTLEVNSLVKKIS